MSKAHLRTSVTHIDSIVNKETGEVIEQAVTNYKYLANSKEPFMFVYLDLLPVLMKLRGSSIKVYLFLLEKFNCGELLGINGAIKELISTVIDTSTGTINNALTELCKSGLLLKSSGKSGGYYINSRYAFRGGSLKRNKSLTNLLKAGLAA